jgi:hypothetical protein
MNVTAMYLLIADRMSEDLRHYSAVKFTVDPHATDSFPPPDQNLVLYGQCTSVNAVLINTRTNIILLPGE